MDLKGRSFLTLKDFTAEEIEYLIDLAAELKEKKKKRVSVTLPEFWEESMTELNTADSDRRSWKSWQNTQVCLCGTA